MSRKLSSTEAHRANQNGGQLVMAALRQAGFDTIFGIPGVHTLDLYRGIAEQGFRHISVRHEQGAGFMADGYARVTGKPALCVVITGPGLTNLATPIGQAFSDSIPMLVLASINAKSEWGKGRGRLHEITDQEAMIAPLTGFTRRLEDISELGPALRDAFRLFAEGRPRPIVLHLPLDLLAEPIALTLENLNLALSPLTASAREQIGIEDIKAAADLLQKAEHPLLLLGGGAIAALDEARALLDKGGLVALSTTAGKGIIPDDHALFLGSTLVSPASQEYLSRADVILALGTELAETDSWIDHLPIRGKLIRVDLDAAALMRDYQPELAIKGDAKVFLQQLLPLYRGGRKPHMEREVASIRALHRAALNPLQRKHMAILEVIRDNLPSEGIVVTDMTQIAYTGNAYFPCLEPRTWLHPNGFGTLGYALPAAIGAKIGAPQRPVLALAGDAGFQFTCQELAVAVELGLNLPVILWNNDALGQIAGDMADADIPLTGVKQLNPDFAALARAYGALSAEPRDFKEFGDAIRAALNRSQPTLIIVREDSSYLSS